MLDTKKDVFDKSVLVVTRDELVKRLAKETEIGYQSVKEIYDVFEEIILDILTQSTPERDVELRWLKGAKIYSRYKEHPTRGGCISEEASKPRKCLYGKFTKTFSNKINGIFYVGKTQDEDCGTKFTGNFIDFEDE